jgi:hypothetical protein
MLALLVCLIGGFCVNWILFGWREGWKKGSFRKLRTEFLLFGKRGAWL